MSEPFVNIHFFSATLFMTEEEVIYFDEESSFELPEYIIYGQLTKLPRFFGISKAFLSQLFEFYFYDVTKIGKKFSNQEKEFKLLKKFGIPQAMKNESLLLSCYLTDNEKNCPRCHQRVKERELLCLICEHYFCRDCWIETINNGFIKCLHDNCNCMLSFEDIYNLLPEAHANFIIKMLRALIFHECKKIPKQCPSCLNKINPKYIKYGNFYCNKCKKILCLFCLNEAHTPLTCLEFQQFDETMKKYMYNNKINDIKIYKELKYRLQKNNFIHNQIKQIVYAINRNVDFQKSFSYDKSVSIQYIYESIKSVFEEKEIPSSFDFDKEFEYFKQIQADMSNYFISFMEKMNEQNLEISRLIHSQYHEYESDSILPIYLNNLSILENFVRQDSFILYNSLLKHKENPSFFEEFIIDEKESSETLPNEEEEEENEEAIESFISFLTLKIILSFQNCFLNYHKNSKNIDFLRILFRKFAKLQFEEEESIFQSDLEYYLILLFYFL